MRIHDYEIRAYKHGWVVAHIKKRGRDSKDEGEEYEAARHYVGSFDQALRLVLDELVGRHLEENPSLERAVSTVAWLYATIGIASQERDND